MREFVVGVFIAIIGFLLWASFSHVDQLWQRWGLIAGAGILGIITILTWEEYS